MIIKKYYKLIRVSHEDSEYLKLKNVSNEEGVFKMNKEGYPSSSTTNLEYSLDGVTWSTYDLSTRPEVAVAAGANIYFRGTNANNKFSADSSNFYYFAFNKTCEISGNICSLLNPDPSVFINITTIGQFGMCYLFYNMNTLTKCSGLFDSITTLSGYALYNLFSGCTSLVELPDFSNLTTVSNNGFAGLCANCTSLTIGPDLSNVTSVTGSIGAIGYGATNMYDVTAPNLQDLNTTVLNGWLTNIGTNVPAGTTKVVRVPAGATITTDSISGIPTGWTRVNY